MQVSNFLRGKSPKPETPEPPAPKPAATEKKSFFASGLQAASAQPQAAQAETTPAPAPPKKKFNFVSTERGKQARVLLLQKLKQEAAGEKEQDVKKNPQKFLANLMSAAKNYNAMSATAKENEVDKPSATTGEQISTPNSTKTNGIATQGTSQNIVNKNQEGEGEIPSSLLSGLKNLAASKQQQQLESEFYAANNIQRPRVGRWAGSGSLGGPGAGSPEPHSRGVSPSMDNYSDLPHGLGRPKSRQDVTGSLSGVPGMPGMPYPSSRYNVSSFWKARRVLFYRNGDPFFPAVEFRFKPGRDISTLDKLLDKISSRMDLPRGARYIFSIDGDRKFSLDEIEDGGSYVVSSFKVFKVSTHPSYSILSIVFTFKN